MQVKQGMKLIVIESNENWSKVHALEKTGWIASRLLKQKFTLSNNALK